MIDINVDMPVRGVNLTGANRLWLCQWLRARYEAGASIRALALQIDRSYANTHQLLKESGVTFRRRGGNMRARAA